MSLDTPQALTDRDTVPRALYVFAALATLLGVAHHVDHVIRGNHVGWPMTPEVNAFTYSLVIYPLIALVLAATLLDRADSRHWAGLFAVGTAMLAYFHISPWAVEPPSDVILPYADPTLGYVAFAVLLALIGTVALATAYATTLYWRDR